MNDLLSKKISEFTKDIYTTKEDILWKVLDNNCMKLPGEPQCIVDFNTGIEQYLIPLEDKTLFVEMKDNLYFKDNLFGSNVSYEWTYI